MKSIKPTLFFVLLTISVFAKDSTTVDFKRFAIGIHASPEYCFRRLVNPIPTTISTLYLNNRNATEIPMIGYSAGVDFSVYIKKHFSVSLGAQYSQLGYSSKEKEITTYAHPEGGLGKSQTRYNYNYIEIPLKANFIFGKKKIQFLASVGINSAFILYEQTVIKSEYYDGTKSTEKGLPNYINNPFNLFLNGSIGADIKLGKKMGLKIEPTFSYGVFQTNTNTLSEYLWSAGLNVGGYIRF